MIINEVEKPVERVMDNAFSKIRSIVDADAVIGKPMKIDSDLSIIPISRVIMGFMTGGGEYGDTANDGIPFAGGSGVGASISPIGFLVIKKGDYKIINVGDKSAFEKILALVPEALETLKDAIVKK